MKNFIIALLEFQARRLLKKHRPKIIAVTGSAGKTSTKLAIATVLSQKYKVLAHYGSYNTPIGLPMAMFDLQLPENLQSASAWLKMLWRMEKKLHQPFMYQYLVLELGTDHPGDIAYFRKYVKPDIAVVTAVAAEHMEYFGTMDAVAQEELSVSAFSGLTLINRDDIHSQYAKYLQTTQIDTYGTSGVAEYHFLVDDFAPGKGFTGKFVSPEFGEQPAHLQVVGEHNIRAVVAAGAIGAKCGLSAAQIIAGMEQVEPVNGRMQLLRGVRDITIIDDTYNSSPLSAIAALQALYVFPAKQRVAILGSMNELGEYSPKAHQEVGSACDPSVLNWVITVGSEAEKYLAPAARAKGCQVRSFASPYAAGGFANEVLERGSVVLAKGSQNGVFTEEAIKILLHSTEEERFLVRQSADWLRKKEQQFDRFPDTSKKSRKQK